MKVKSSNELIQQVIALESSLEKKIKYWDNLEPRLNQKVKEVFEPYLKPILPEGSKVSYSRRNIKMKRIGMDGYNVGYGIMDIQFPSKEKFNYYGDAESVEIVRFIREDELANKYNKVERYNKVEKELLSLIEDREKELVKLMNDVITPFNEKERKTNTVIEDLKEELRVIYKDLKNNYPTDWKKHIEGRSFHFVSPNTL